MKRSQLPKLVPILAAPAPTPENTAPGDDAGDRYPTPAATSGSSAASTPREPLRSRPKRYLVETACDNCRRRKTKCNGVKPTCGPCLKKRDECIYNNDTSEVTALTLKRKHNSLEQDNVRYRELFLLLRNKPRAESEDIFLRLRASDDPLRVLEAVRQADMLLPDPGSNDRLGHSQLAKLDDSALNNSAIKVHARPWTVVIDDGLLSELITNLFTWDYCCAVDRDSFLEDMAAGDAEKARWCSPLLVNAICALRCQFSERARFFAIQTQQNLSQRFLQEAKMFLDREKGRASIPTVQGLIFMYLATALGGSDRAARVYRFTAYTMLRRLRLEERFHDLKTREPSNVQERRVISSALWGLFTIESRVAFFYAQPSILPAPNVPILFPGYETAGVDGIGNVDVLDRPFKSSNCRVPLVLGANVHNCKLAELWNELMCHLTSDKAVRGSDADILLRKAFYSRLRQFREQLPSRFFYEKNLTPSTCFLRMHEHEITYTILQHLPLDTPFETPYSSPNATVKTILLQACRGDTGIAELYISKWPFDGLVTRAILSTMHNLIPMLDDLETHDLFVRQSIMARLSTRTMKLAGHMFQAAQALAWALKKPIPMAARPYLEDWGQEAVEKDLPLDFVLPHLEDIKDLLASDVEADTAGVEGHLGFLLERWAML
ncbi:hypothetical protein QQX98_004059 [Neonectria punicea]|uniref:Zn(2)-C6 fungal-type domain-containing protein n=1 Tax=Neonectria punicea TaxID=979145 RepID=A0ABR1HB41_9HYPO